MVGGLRCVLINVKCDPNWLRGYGAVGVENGPSQLLWPVAYTTACTTVQAVTSTSILVVTDSVILIFSFNYSILSAFIAQLK